MQHATPSVKQNPKPDNPRWRETISVPNPIMVVSALTITPRPMAQLSRPRPSAFDAR
jgi:hypothetical protein